MKPTTPVDYAPFSGPGFGEARCRRYLFDRAWCEDPRSVEGEPAPASRPAPAPQTKGWDGRLEGRR